MSKYKDRSKGEATEAGALGPKILGGSNFPNRCLSLLYFINYIVFRRRKSGFSIIKKKDETIEHKLGNIIVILGITLQAIVYKLYLRERTKSLSLDQRTMGGGRAIKFSMIK